MEFGILSSQQLSVAQAKTRMSRQVTLFGLAKRGCASACSHQLASAGQRSRATIKREREESNQKDHIKQMQSDGQTQMGIQREVRPVSRERGNREGIE